MSDLEDEIFARETCVQELQRDLARAETYRSGDYVRQLLAELAEHQKALKMLYAHWEEAAETKR